MYNCIRIDIFVYICTYNDTYIHICLCMYRINWDDGDKAKK